MSTASSPWFESSPAGYTPHIDEALALAAIVHQRQHRKGTAVPYLIHPVQVGWILDRHGYGEELVLAGLLHDVLEDACWEDSAMADALRATFPELNPAGESASLRESVEQLIAGRFGARVLELVAALSERKTDAAGQRRSWKDRKSEQLATFAQAGTETMALKAADLIHNLHSTQRDVEARGLETFQRFNAGAHDQLGHYVHVVQLVHDRLGPESTIAAELGATFAALCEAIGRAAAASADEALQAATKAAAQACQTTH